MSGHLVWKPVPTLCIICLHLCQVRSLECLKASKWLAISPAFLQNFSQHCRITCRTEQQRMHVLCNSLRRMQRSMTLDTVVTNILRQVQSGVSVCSGWQVTVLTNEFCTSSHCGVSAGLAPARISNDQSAAETKLAHLAQACCDSFASSLQGR